MLGDILQAKRKDKKLSQQNVAEIFFVSRQTISSWETGKSFPDIPTLIKLSDFYDISLDSLIKGDENLMKKLTSDQIMFQLFQRLVWVSVFGIPTIITALWTFMTLYKSNASTNVFINSAPMYLLMTIAIFWIIFFYREDLYIKTNQLKEKIIQFIIYGILFFAFIIPLFLFILSVLIISGYLSI